MPLLFPYPLTERHAHTVNCTNWPATLQIASEQGYTCWDGEHEVPLTDFLNSPNNEASPDDVDGPIFGDSGPRVPALTPGGSAGVVIGVVVIVCALAGVGYFWGYRRVWRERRAKRFERFEDSGSAVPADGGCGGGGGASDDTTATVAAAAAAPAAAAAAAAAADVAQSAAPRGG